LEISKENLWTEVITPKKGLLDFNVKEIWKYRDSIMLFVRRDFVSTYKQTILGPIWFFIQPLFTAFIFFIIFTRIAKLPTDGVPPILFYLSGITIWNYFAECFTKTSNVFIANASIFGKVYFPRLTNPISIIISSLIKFGIQFLLYIFILGYYILTNQIEFSISLELFLLPFLILIMAMLSLGLGIIFSSLTTKYRDLTFLLQFGIQLLMYATPVIYPIAATSGKLRKVLELNPLTPLVESFRKILLGQSYVNYEGLIYCCVISMITLFVGIVIFNQVEKSFMDTV
jgi:lipopolysaccharide transport system permease protein